MNILLSINQELFDQIESAGFDLKEFVCGDKIKDLKEEDLTEETKKAIKVSDEEIKKGEVEKFKTVEDLFESLND